MQSMSVGWAQTSALLDEGKTAEAALVFRKDVAATVKKLYSEAGDTYPVRYGQKVECWSAWAKQVYVLTRKAEAAFAENDAAGARKQMMALREHFYTLHAESDLLGANDHIYRFMALLGENEPSLASLRETEDLIRHADAAPRTGANTDGFTSARDAWLAAVSPMLEGDWTPEKKAQLRDATLSFYQAYGVQFE